MMFPGAVLSSENESHHCINCTLFHDNSLQAMLRESEKESATGNDKADEKEGLPQDGAVVHHAGVFCCKQRLSASE